MFGFRQTMLSTCWLIPAMGTFYFWVVALSTFIAARSSEPSTSPIPSPNKCDPEAIKNTISIWIRWMIVLAAAALSILYYVRKVVEASADAEAKGNSFQDEAYKLAREELKQAMTAVNSHLTTLASLPKPTPDSLDNYVKSVGERNILIAKVARTKPKEGLARLPRGMQARMRLLFFWVIFFSFWAGFCSAVAFYLSLRLQVVISHRLQIRCDDGLPEVAPFLVVGFIFLAVHMEAAWVAFTED